MYWYGVDPAEWGAYGADLTEAKQLTGAAMGGAPPGADIALAIIARGQLEMVWKPLIKAHLNSERIRFFEMNPDATPREYFEAGRAGDEFLQGNW
jgi:hypothetical protein